MKKSMNTEKSGRKSLGDTQTLFCFVMAIALIISSCQSNSGGNTTGTDKQTSVDSLAIKNGAELYPIYCAGCHGRQFQGSSGPALVNTTFKHGSDFDSIRRSIYEGVPSTEMIAYSNLLSDEQIDQITTYIIEAGKSPDLIVEDNMPSRVKTQHYELEIEQMVSEGLERPWAFEFLNADSALVTFSKGGLHWLVGGKVDPQAIQGTPKTYATDMFGGMKDVAFDPDYKTNGWVYLAYSYNSTGTTDSHAPGTTKVVRGKVKNNRWTDEQVLFQAHDSVFVAKGLRWGCRFLFDKKGYLYFTIGEMLGPREGGGRRPQFMTRPEGKIFRIHSDGSIPKDNPLYGKKDVLQAIYAWGSRNAQGIARHPVTGEIYFSEHGPQGGDELNRLKNGANYGWPDITYGIDYDGGIISGDTHREGMEQPVTYWTPSIAVSAIEFVSGNRFPKWNNDLLVTALKFEEVRRLVIENDKVKEEEILLKGYGRVRDIKIGPDGALYVLTNTPDALWRVTPKVP